PHALPRRSCRGWRDAESSFCSKPNRAADPPFNSKPQYESAAFQCQAMCSAEMQKPGPFFSRFGTGLEKVLIAGSINLIRFLERRAVFFAKIEFPGSEGPDDLLLYYLEQKLAVCLYEKLSRPQIRKSLLKGVHVRFERETKEERRMGRTGNAVSITSAVGERPYHRAKIKTTNSKFSVHFVAQNLSTS